MGPELSHAGVAAQRKLSSRSDRVKSVDLHPVEPWVLSAMYNGHCFLWNYSTQSLVKSFEVSDQPVRAGKFVARKQWIVVGSDDMQIRVYNYNTMEKIKVFEAHSDYIRSLAVHPSQPLVLSSSDDMTIRSLACFTDVPKPVLLSPSTPARSPAHQTVRLPLLLHSQSLADLLNPRRGGRPRSLFVTTRGDALWGPTA